jgi:antitoxin YefM
MALETTWTKARASFAALCDTVSQDREVVIIHRRNADDVALIAADELTSLMETAPLLRAPRNAERLLTALAHARGETVPTESLDSLRLSIGLHKEN